MLILCPPPVALTTIPQPTCDFKLDQLRRFAFQRRQPTATPPFTTLADFQTLADWETFKAAADATKIVMSPLFVGAVIPASEALTSGGNDNSTANGIPNYNGEGMVTVTGQFQNLPPITKRGLDLLSQESLASAVGVSNLTIYPINRLGYIFPVNPVDGAGAATTIYKGIPIYNFRVSSLGSEGLNATNIHNFSFSVPADWADYLAAVKPNFDPLVDL